MLISNIQIDQTVEVVIDNTVLKVVDTRKHLGVLLSSNNKWTSHIDSIINSASKQVSFLRKIKVVICGKYKNLNKITKI